MEVKDEFLDQRDRMVIELMKQGYLKTDNVIKVFKEIPRHLFVGEHNRKFAYMDRPLPIQGGQTISAPHMVAMMTEVLGAKKTDKILEVGAGSGYQAAILSKLAKKVYTTEINSDLVVFARNNLKMAGTDNVDVMEFDGSRGYPKRAPYDKIIVTCASPEIYGSWVNQVKRDGIILAPVGDASIGYQELIRAVKTKEGLKKENFGGCAFVPLRR